MKEKNSKEKTEIEKKVSEANICRDKNCPFHGRLSARGRRFKGYIIKLYGKRGVIELERFIFIKKYERYARKRTRLHVHLPDCLADKVKLGSYVLVMECRPLSKMIHHVVTEVKEEQKSKEFENESSAI